MQFPPPCYGDSERRAMSALWSIVDITSLIEKVRFVPEADTRACRPKPHSLLKSLGQGVPKYGLEKAAVWQMPPRQLSEESRISLKLKMVLSHQDQGETSPCSRSLAS